jgi:pyruvate kinase
MRRQRKVKIIATLGPSSSDLQTIEKLVQSGVDVFRMNFSHGKHAEHKTCFDRIRLVEKKLGYSVGILMDLQGPKIRIGDFKNNQVVLNAHSQFTLDISPKLGDENRVSLMHPEVFLAIKKESILLLDDGKIKLIVDICDETQARCTVIEGGILSNRKGLSLPNSEISLSSLTKKDHEDLKFGLEIGVDFVALSFVQRAEDIIEAQEIIKNRALIISKLEKPQAIDNLKKIVELSDGVMIARGDLGVECSLQTVPILQKRIIDHCRSVGKPVIVATQMLESMINSTTPTRAEVSDVANAVYDGTDAVMLSAESAVGINPAQAVSIMSSVIGEVESDWERLHFSTNYISNDGISNTVKKIVSQAKASVIFTHNNIASKLSSERPMVPIVGLVNSQMEARRLSFTWGVHAVISEYSKSSMFDFIKISKNILEKEEFIKSGDSVVITADINHKEKINFIHIMSI